ncbi:MAG: twin-arginine translocase subunit TatC, partial [Chloroflexota bacterium]
MARSAPPQTPPEPPPEKEPNEKYLTLMEHLSELRYRVVVCALAVVIGLSITAVFAHDIIEFLEEPAKDRSEEFQPQFIEPFENFVVYFKVALLGGLV